MKPRHAHGRDGRLWRIRRPDAWVAVLGVLLGSAALAADDGVFDHDQARFPLVGAHERISCESCHVGGRFRGTPIRCFQCHDGSGIRADTYRDVSHIRTTNDCDSCHLVLAWSPARVDHDSVLGSCGTCHDGFTATGRPPMHPPSSNRCEDCHGTVTWAGARFDHAGVTGACVTCHDGNTATGKPGDHPPTSNLCEDCHITLTWDAIRFDHTGITAACVTCHNGIDATGKSGGHVASTNVCEACHRPGGWTPFDVDHTQVSGSCNGCHDGATATGRPSGHFQTNAQCDTCHTTQAWLPHTFRHTSPNYPGDHRGPPECQACHAANSETVVWRFPAYQPDCAGCHASDFKADEHKKVDSPRILYTPGELRDCTGACHTYTDATFTTIERARSGEHRPGAGDW